MAIGLTLSSLDIQRHLHALTSWGYQILSAFNLHPISFQYLRLILRADSIPKLAPNRGGQTINKCCYFAMNVRPILSLSISFLFEKCKQKIILRFEKRSTLNVKISPSLLFNTFKNESHWAAMKMLERSAVCF